MAQEFYTDGAPSRTIADDDGDDAISMIVAEREADKRHIAALEAALRGIANHWYEFGSKMIEHKDDYGLGERIEAAAKLVGQGEQR